ncbi:hypothetical protein F4781DRAFT_438166 [Annulohypoxylon bovei var. microspora]|nr:hypothetical protein F4781DRAFT_438166 [Annulohypoxylon bovei var. microspora]
MAASWDVTDDLSPSDLSLEEAVLERVQGGPPYKMLFKTLANSAVAPVCKFLYERGEPPCVSLSYVRYLVLLNAFRNRMLGSPDWPFHQEEPETHAAPYSLAYVEYWYDRAHQGESAGDGDGDGGAESPAENLMPRGVEPTDPELMKKLWSILAGGQEVAEGLRPFEIALPASSNFWAVFASPEEVEPFLAELAATVGGRDILVFLSVGVGPHPQPVKVFLGICPDVDVNNVGLRLRVSLAWEMLCLFGARAAAEDVNLLGFAQDFYERFPDLRTGSAQSRYEAVASIWLGIREQLLEASAKSRRMALLRAAQVGEMDRLAADVSAKLLEGEDSFDGKTDRLARFVELGDEAIPLAMTSARARVAERLTRGLAADLVKEIFLPGRGKSAKEQASLVAAFVLDGDDRLANLDASARLEVAEEVWVPISQAKSQRPLKRRKTALAKLRDKLEAPEREAFDQEEDEDEEDEDEEG